MEVYILDAAMRRQTVVDKFESMIWAERFAANGDLELDVFATPENRNKFKVGQRCAMNESYYVMQIETIQDGTDSEGKSMLKIKGRDIVSILESRAARDTMANTTTEPTWNLTGLPAALARQMFHDICVLGQLNAADIITGINETSLFATETTAEPADTITLKLSPQSLYKAIQDLCVTYNMGFRMIRDPLTSQLYFNIYMGDNRTTGQTVLPAVIFSPELDNVQNITSLTSIAGAMNVAHVVSPAGTLLVYGDAVDPLISSFDRRVLMVDASDITGLTGTPLTNALTQRGKEALAQNRQVSAIDAEITQYSQYKYNTHYRLGDLVDIQTVTGAKNRMQVTEQIFVSDGEGERSYPTLQLNTFINAGSWLARPATQKWTDVSPTERWIDA